jgi:hypothetical protein
MAKDNYRVDTNAIVLKVKQEFAAKEKVRTVKPKPKLAKKSAAA